MVLDEDTDGSQPTTQAALPPTPESALNSATKATGSAYRHDS